MTFAMDDSGRQLLLHVFDHLDVEVFATVVAVFFDLLSHKRLYPIQSWEALADVLQLKAQQACPDAFHQGDGITQLTQTAAFLQSRTKSCSVQSRPCRILYVGQQRPLFICLSDFSQMVQ